MKLYQILFLFFTTLFCKSLSSKNSNYDVCSEKLKCGNLDDEVGYPFYDGSIRPDYCGYPGFKLNCSQDIAQITINQTNFYVSQINSEKHSVSVYREDKWKSFCPDSLGNTAMDYSKFNFTSSDQNISFFYDCGESKDLSSLLLQTSCNLGKYGSNSGYYLTQAMLDQYKYLDLSKICNASLFIPILKSNAHGLDRDPHLARLQDAFMIGFELSLMAENDVCSTCDDSGGECGYNWASNKFVCHCDDSDYDDHCKDDSSEQGGKPKRTLVIGMSIGVVALLALFGGCIVLARRRRSQVIASQKTREIHPTYGISSNSGAPLVAGQGSNGLTSSQAYTTTPSTTLSQNTPSYASSMSDIAADKSCYFGVHVFDYTVLEHATCNFHDSKELGDGGFGIVYYGVLPDGRQVAVKRLYENSFKRVEQYMNEIKLLAELHHKNLVCLYGCTSRRSRELLLVYEYVSNGTVADHIHGKLAESTFVPWLTRLNIAVETAEALAFLHRNDVIHRDVKTTNILLDNQFHVKVADFGLSRLFPIDVTHVSTAPQGTPGYVDPEYYQCYKLTEKSDVYSFGVVLIELISSKHAVDISRHRHHVNLANMALDWIQSQEIYKLVDSRLGFDKDHSIQAMVKMVGELGFRCLQQDRDMRPTMDEVLVSLRAIQLEGLKPQKQQVVDIIVYEDDVGLLTNPTPPLSPEFPRTNDVV